MSGLRAPRVDLGQDGWNGRESVTGPSPSIQDWCRLTTDTGPRAGFTTAGTVRGDDPPCPLHGDLSGRNALGVLVVCPLRTMTTRRPPLVSVQLTSETFCKYNILVRVFLFLVYNLVTLVRRPLPVTGLGPSGFEVRVSSRSR